MLECCCSGLWSSFTHMLVLHLQMLRRYSNQSSLLRYSFLVDVHPCATLHGFVQTNWLLVLPWHSMATFNHRIRVHCR